MNFIDLFAGAGGLSEGFIRAGFKPIAHVEFDRAACFTLRTRAAFYYFTSIGQPDIYDQYLKQEITRDELYAQIPKEVHQSIINAKIGDDNKAIFKTIDALLKDKSVDLIIGGPPCQAYSYIGRAALKNKVHNDSRNILYQQYGKFLTKYKPKMFVFENVPGIITAGGGQYYKNLKKYFKRIGYEMDEQKLNALEYGVIQNRTRLIIVGWLKGTKLHYPNLECTTHSYTIKDIFNDLPAIGPNNSERITKYTQVANKYLTDSAIRNGKSFVTQHNTRPLNSKDSKIYKLAIQELKKGIRLKNNAIPLELRTQKNTEDFLDRFKVVDNIPHTVIAHICKDGHHYIHPSSKATRSISIREAARIQSFPDNFFFEGVKASQNRSAAFKQIGNAVPPLLAYTIAQAIKAQLICK